MLSLPKCRAAITSREKMADADLERLRDEMYPVAAIVVGMFEEQRRQKRQMTAFDRALDLMDEAARDVTEERAAILEFDAGYSRALAERKAASATLTDGADGARRRS